MGHRCSAADVIRFPICDGEQRVMVTHDRGAGQGQNRRQGRAGTVATTRIRDVDQSSRKVHEGQGEMDVPRCRPWRRCRSAPACMPIAAERKRPKTARQPLVPAVALWYTSCVAVADVCDGHILLFCVPVSVLRVRWLQGHADGVARYTRIPWRNAWRTDGSPFICWQPVVDHDGHRSR